MKVLLLVDEFPPNIWGGMGKSVSLLGQHLQKLSVKVNVLTVNRQGEELVRSRFRKLKVFSVSKSKEKIFIIKYLIESKPDIIHINGRHYASFVKYFKSCNIKIIYTSRSNFLEEVKSGSLRYNKEKNRRQEILLRLSDHVVATSKNESESLISTYPWLKKKLSVIPNGIDPEQDKPLDPETKLKRFNMNQIFFAGRFVKQKGINILISIIPRILKANPDAIIVIAGGHGNMVYQRKISLLANKYKNIKYVGWLDNHKIQKYYEKSNVVLMLSNYEPFGLVSLESMIKSCIVIANTTGGLKEIIKNNYNGFLVNNDNLTGIVNLILDILKNNKSINYLRKHALKTAINSYRINNTAEAYLNLYKRVL